MTPGSGVEPWRVHQPVERPRRAAHLGLRLKHSGLLAVEIVRVSSRIGAWWLAPVAFAVALMALVLATSSAALPVAVYALF